MLKQCEMLAYCLKFEKFPFSHEDARGASESSYANVYKYIYPEPRMGQRTLVDVIGHLSKILTLYIYIYIYIHLRIIYRYTGHIEKHIPDYTFKGCKLNHPHLTQ